MDKKERAKYAVQFLSVFDIFPYCSIDILCVAR